MDPISALFASYIDLVSNTAKEHYSDVVGTKNTVLMVEHKGIKIPYEYQLWKIRDKSVCANYKNNVAQFSKCTMAAKSLFNDACTLLKQQGSNHGKQKQLKTMYCRSAITFKPTVASISRVKKLSNLEKARAECNMAIANAMGSEDSMLINKQEVACNEYKNIK